MQKISILPLLKVYIFYNSLLIISLLLVFYLKQNCALFFIIFGKNNGTSTYTGTETNANVNSANSFAVTLTANWVQTTPYNFAYTGNAQTFTVPVTGYYRVELWGASGGTDLYGTATTEDDGYGGSGGYTSGIINIQNNKSMYIYLGASGEDHTMQTFNGGGSTGGAASGGGSADIRLSSGSWYDFSSLKSRIMVAAGGGGGENHNNNGGAGGGLIGYANVKNGAFIGGTQTSGSTFGGREKLSFTINCSSQNTCVWGGFGQGYYSGYTATSAFGGGGGSSFISGHSGCNAISSSSTESNIIHTGQANHYSGYTFTNTVMIDGAGYKWTNTKGSLQQMPNPNGGYYASGVGHTGNGYARITYLGTNI